MTEISDEVSDRINLYSDQLLDYLESQPLDNNPSSPLMACFLDYCIPTLRNHFQAELIKEIPGQHKRAIIACHLSAQLFYTRGLTWRPSIVNILPLILDYTSR